MLKNRLIQIRLNNSQFKQITEKAEDKNQSTSEYARKILLQPEVDIAQEESKTGSLAKIPVFERPEFLKTLIWIYSKHGVTYGERDLKEPKLYASLIDSFIMDLEPKYLEYFYNVKKDINRAIRDYNSLFGLEYKFNKSNESMFFNYREFEKMFLDDLM